MKVKSLNSYWEFTGETQEEFREETRQGIKRGDIVQIQENSSGGPKESPVEDPRKSEETFRQGI